MERALNESKTASPTVEAIESALRGAAPPDVVFDETSVGLFRYYLQWPTGLDNDRMLLFIGANPSRAGQWNAQAGSMLSDPTVSRMRNLAERLDFGRLGVANARSFVATDPRDVPPDPEAIGADTDKWITAAVRVAELVVCGWGHLGGARGPVVLDLIRANGKVPHALLTTKDGLPRHPRGIPKSALPFPLNERTAP